EVASLHSMTSSARASSVGGTSAPAMSDLSWFNPTPHAIAVYASQPLSPVAAQHSLPSGRYSLLGPDFHRLDRTSLRLAHSFDHLVGAGEQRGRDGEANRLGGRQVDDKFELGRLLHGDIGRLRPAQNLIDKLGCTPELGLHAWPIGHQASCFDKLAGKMNRRQSQTDRQVFDSIPVYVYERVATNINCVHSTIERVEGGHDILGPPEFESSDLKTKHAGRCLSCAHFQHGLWVPDIGQYRQ